MKPMMRVLLVAILLISPWGAATAQEADELKLPAHMTNDIDKRLTVDEVPVSACLQVRFIDRVGPLHGVVFAELKLNTATFPYRVVEGTLKGDTCSRDWRAVPTVSTVGQTLELHFDNFDRTPGTCASHVDVTGAALSQPPGWIGNLQYFQDVIPQVTSPSHILFMGYTECPRRP